MRKGTYMDWKIELIPLAVKDVDRSIEFYSNLVGWNIDHDQKVHEGLRFVQVTPPGSACSFCFGIGLEMMPDGVSQMIQVVVADADEARDYLRERGVECADVDEQAWGRFVRFEDPDGTGGRSSSSSCPPPEPSGTPGHPVTWSTKHQRQSSPGSAERATG